MPFNQNMFKDGAHMIMYIFLSVHVHVYDHELVCPRKLEKALMIAQKMQRWHLPLQLKGRLYGAQDVRSVKMSEVLRSLSLL